MLGGIKDFSDFLNPPKMRGKASSCQSRPLYLRVFLFVVASVLCKTPQEWIVIPEKKWIVM